MAAAFFPLHNLDAVFIKAEDCLHTAPKLFSKRQELPGGLAECFSGVISQPTLSFPSSSLQKKAGFERLGEFSALWSIGKIIALFHQWKKIIKK